MGSQEQADEAKAKPSKNSGENAEKLDLPKIGKPKDKKLNDQSDGTIKRYVFPAGTTLFAKGEERYCAFLIDTGEVQIVGNDEGGEDKMLCTLGEGEIFGEMAMIDNSPRSASAVTTKETEIYVIPRNTLQQRITGMDPIISLIIGLLVDRYRFSRIHMPESLKRGHCEGDNDLISKLSKLDQLPDDMMRIHDDMHEQRAVALREIRLEQEIRAGLDKREFIPYLQPILNLETGRVCGFEALARWNHPQKGILAPNHFINVAERTNVIQEIDFLMLEHACEIAPRLNELQPDKLDEHIFISVNLSGINFANLDLVGRLRGALINSGMPPEWLKLELTESALIDEPEHAEKVLKGLRALGFKIALDDFGTGYSSLSYLHKFSIDTLKIDRSFVAQLHEGKKSMDLVRAIVSLAKNFKLDVVAEGIEHEKDIAVLSTLQCDMGQGFYFGKPMPVEEAYEFAKYNLEQTAKS
jgi:EAL domain-containing protein (putative c-di-GMP-specific phosphodiesterase class I)/CRP-like cAMP-binding protein